MVHLVRAMTKLLPDWLPHELYAVLLARWRSPGRLERWVLCVVLEGGGLESLWRGGLGVLTSAHPCYRMA